MWRGGGRSMTDASSIEDWYTASVGVGVSVSAVKRQSGDGCGRFVCGEPGDAGAGPRGVVSDSAGSDAAGRLGRTSILETEPINPLYTGAYAVGPYIGEHGGTVGERSRGVRTSDLPAMRRVWWWCLLRSGRRAAATRSADGTEVTPAAASAQGWWTGMLCGYGHSAWSSLSVKGGPVADGGGDGGG